MKLSHHRLLSLVAFSFCFSLSAAPAELRISERPGGIVISGQVPAEIDVVELRLFSGRNARISRISDVSPRVPADATRTPSAHIGQREVYYPVIDVALEPGMEGFASLDREPDLSYLNQHFHKSPLPKAREVRLDPAILSEWENALFVAPGSVGLKEFYLRIAVPVIHGSFHRQIRLLSAQWSGRVGCYRASGEKLAEASFSTSEAPPQAKIPGEVLSPERLRDSIVESIGYLLRSQERNPASPSFGGLNLFYDLDAATYRTNYWIWAWGPAVRLLLEADRRPELAAKFAPGRLRQFADEIGRASLRFMVRDPAHPARGVPVSRWNRNLSFATGFEERISVADAQFLAGWAWLPLYRATGNAEYLTAARTLADATDRLLGEFGVVPQDYYHEIRKWSDHIVDEAGFGMEGLAELYRETKDARHLDIGRRYFESVRTKLERPDGVWNRGWSRTEGIQPAGFIARGMGWAMEGLLAAHRVMPTDGYLERARRLGERLIGWQHPDGSWSFNADKPVAAVGIAEKATALWSMLFFNLHRETNDPRHLAAARRALQWCVENQYFGPDVEARGSVPGIGPASAVGYRQWFQVSCTYTSAFFGLAALESLERAP